MINRKNQFRNIGVLHSNRKKKLKSSFYGHMFLQDMCMDFSISFSPTINGGEFFEIYPKSSIVDQLLRYKNHSPFLRYDFNQQLSWILNELMLSGRAYIKICPVIEEQEIVAIKFEHLFPERVSKRRKVTIFSERDYSGKISKKAVQNDRIVKFDLKDLGIERSYFKKILKGLSRLEIPDFKWLTKKEIPLNDYEAKRKLSALKIVGKTYWDLRDRNNENVTRVYSLYKDVMFKHLRYKFLEYFLNQYNQALNYLGEQYDFVGEIIIVPELNNHIEDLDKLLAGEINCDQMADILFTKYK